MHVLTAGFGFSKITPPPGTHMAGYAARTARSQGVHDELHVRALILDDGERPLAMVSVDVLALDSAFVERARAEISVATGLAADFDAGFVAVTATDFPGLAFASTWSRYWR